MMRPEQSPNSPLRKPAADPAEEALAYLVTTMARLAARERFDGGNRDSIR